MEQKLKWEDLIEGECYAAMTSDNRRYVFQKNGKCQDEDLKGYLQPGGTVYTKAGPGHNVSIKTNSSFPYALPATPQEKADLLASMEKGTFTKGTITPSTYDIF